MIVSRENCSKASISVGMLWSSCSACSNDVTQLRFVQHKLGWVWNCRSVESGKILKHRNSLYAPNLSMGYGLHGTPQLSFLYHLLTSTFKQLTLGYILLQQGQIDEDPERQFWGKMLTWIIPWILKWYYFSFR